MAEIETNKDLYSSQEEIITAIGEIDYTIKGAFGKTMALFTQYRKICSSNVNEIKSILIDVIKNKVGSDWTRFLFEAFIQVRKTSEKSDKVIEKVLAEICNETLIVCGIDEGTLNVFSRDYYKSSDHVTFIKTFLSSVSDQSKNSKCQFDSYDLALICFVWIASRLYSGAVCDRNEISFSISRAFAETFADLSDSTVRSLSKTCVVSALQKNNMKDLGKLVFLFRDTSKVIALLSEERDNYRCANERLIVKNNEFENEITLLMKVIEEDKKKLEQSHSEALAYKEGMIAAEGMLKFETNKQEKQLSSLKTSLSEKLRSDIGLEIEGINDIVESIPEEVRKMLQRRLSRIKKIIDELGEV